MSTASDLLALAFAAVKAHRLRSVLSMAGIAVGVSSVIALTSVGEGTRRFLLDQFTQFGTHVVKVTPGKSKTLGVPGALGGTTHPIGLDDAVAITNLPQVKAALPLVVGQAAVSAGNRSRSVIVYGVTPDVTKVFEVRVRNGSFWPSDDPFRDFPFAVLGPSLERELFDQGEGLGQFIHIGSRRFRVIGTMAPVGQLLGMDLGDTVYVPVAAALEIFNLNDVTEVDVLYDENLTTADRTAEAIRRLLTSRHDGEEDFTILTQEAMLDVFGNIMNIITMSVGAIAAISLLVGAIGILTMMWIAVGERRAEIGLIRALGATRGQVSFLFLTEAATLASIGGLVGVAAGIGGCRLLATFVSGLPIATPREYIIAALAVSFFTGLAAGAVPARHAARLDPVESLRAE